MGTVKTTEPFLFQFKKEGVSPSRAVPDDHYFYEPESCQVMTIRDGKKIPAIEVKDGNGPKTKKMHVEKGEDQKDRWIWR